MATLQNTSTIKLSWFQLLDTVTVKYRIDIVFISQITGESSVLSVNETYG